MNARTKRKMANLTQPDNSFEGSRGPSILAENLDSLFIAKENCDSS